MPHKPSKKRSANVFKIHTHPLYSRPQRLAIPILLVLLILYGLVLLAWAIVFTVVSDLAYQGPSSVVIAILKWDIIPLICALTSIIQSVQRRRRTLRSSEILVAGLSATAAWIGYGFLGFVEANAWNEGFDGTMFVMAAAGIVLNLVYVGFGTVALRAERHPKSRKMELGCLPAYVEGEGRLPSYGPESGEFERDGKEDV